MLLAVTCMPVSAASAQPVAEALWSDCIAGRPSSIHSLCADAALGLQALHGGVGLQMTAGGALPASPSTAGHRMERSPRIILDGGGSWSTFRHPNLARSGGPGPTPDKRTHLTGARIAAVVGLFDGFSPAPGVGGVLAVDLVGTIQWVRVPSSPATAGSSVGWGGGLRLGVFRESFSLPGVTLSSLFHRAGKLEFGITEGDGALATLDPSVTSTRLTVGKDLWPVGLSVGAGWDRYRGEGRIEARSGSSGPGAILARSSLRKLSMNRRYVFVGANITWIVSQIAAEVTWGRKGSPLARLDGTGPFSPGDRELGGALSFRVIY